MQYVSVNFSTNTAPIGTKLDTRFQWAPTMLVLQLNGNSRVYRELGLRVDTILEKTVFFDTFFTNRLITNVTAGSVGSTCYPTGHSTATSYQLAVSFLCRTLLVLQFWLFSVMSVLSEVKTSEDFSRLWLALGPPNYLHWRLFWRWLRKCHQFLARVRESMTRP